MLKPKAKILAAALLISSSAAALDINSTAGQLASLIGDDLDITSLTVTGQLDASDMAFIASLPSLKTLNLSGATIEAYKGDALPSGSYSADANTIPAYIFLGLTTDQLVLPTGVTSIGESAFAGSAISSITIPATVTEIGRYAFADCPALTSVTVPATVTAIADGVFSGCSSLKSATIDAAVDSIGGNMFANCTSLSSVSLNRQIATIGDNAFAGCTSLKAIELPTATSAIGAKAFYGSALQSIDLSKAANVSIADFAFAECKSLSKVVFPDAATIGQGLFFDDAALKSIVMPGNIAAIPSFTFKGTNSINPEQVLSDNITSIGDYALTGWDQVSEITLPSALQSIGDNAMADWSAIATIYADQLSTVPALGETVWENVDQADAILYVSEDTYDEFAATDQWKEFKVTMRTTGINDTTSDAVANDIDFYLDGTTLVINSRGSNIVATSIYDLNGRRCYSQTGSAQQVRIAAAAWTPGIIIAHVTLENGTTTAIKIALN